MAAPQPGQSLPPVRKELTQEKIARYAEASGDVNPIHLDTRFAAAGPYGRTIAHGMLVLAYVAEMMALAFGEGWLAQGQLNVRFRAPAYPGDTLCTAGEVQRLVSGPSGKRAVCKVRCLNQQGQVLVEGEASAALP